MTTWLSDEVWRQLDRNKGRLSRRGTMRAWLAILAAGAVFAAGLAVWRSGVIAPRLEWPRNAGIGFEAGQRHIRYQLTIVNQGWTTETITGYGRSGPGLHLLAVHAPPDVRLALGDTVDIAIEYEVTDCAAVPADPWPVPVRVHRVWGEVTAWVQPPTQPSEDAPSSYSYSGRSPYEVEWQRGTADLACQV